MKGRKQMEGEKGGKNLWISWNMGAWLNGER